MLRFVPTLRSFFLEHFASGASKADSTTAIHIEISSWGMMGWVNSMCMLADGAKGTQEACCRHWPLVLSSRWMGTLVAPLIQPTTIAIKGSKQCNAQAVQGSEQRVYNIDCQFQCWTEAVIDVGFCVKHSEFASATLGSISCKAFFASKMVYALVVERLERTGPFSDGLLIIRQRC